MMPRLRYDQNGNCIGSHTMIFDEIPDDYVVDSIFLNGKFGDLSNLGIFKHLKGYYADKPLKGFDLGIEFQNEEWFRSEIFMGLSLDYLNSARYLWKAIDKERGKDMVSYYLIPCTYLCKHSIELMLKRCLLAKGITEFKGHSVKKLWEKLDEKQLPHYLELSSFIDEVEQIDSNEMALRYGLDNGFKLLPSDLYYDIDKIIANAMFLFNIVDEHIIWKYR